MPVILICSAHGTACYIIPTHPAHSTANRKSDPSRAILKKAGNGSARGLDLFVSGCYHQSNAESRKEGSAVPDVTISPCSNYDAEAVYAALERALEPLGGLDWVSPGMRITVEIIKFLSKLDHHRALAL